MRDDGEKYSDYKYILKEEPTGFGDKLNEDCDKKREPKIIPRFGPEQLERWDVIYWDGKSVGGPLGDMISSSLLDTLVWDSD